MSMGDHFDFGKPEVRELARRFGLEPGHLPPLQVCLQVNTDGEPTKSGAQPGDVLALALVLALRLRPRRILPALGIRRFLAGPRLRWRTMRQVLRHQIRAS